MIHSDFKDNPEFTCDSYCYRYTQHKRCRKEVEGTKDEKSLVKLKKVRFFGPTTIHAQREIQDFVRSITLKSAHTHTHTHTHTFNSDNNSYIYLSLIHI